MADAPGLTHSRALKIAIPIILGNITVPILGAVDTGVVGQLGEAAPIGAVGIGAIILGAIYWIFGFLRMGTAGLASQAHGAGDTDEVSSTLSRALLIGLTGALLLVLFQGPIFTLSFMISPASAEVEALARSYMSIRIFSAPAAISIYALTGWLIALERTRAVLVLQIWINGVNILLDLAFVLGLDWGVEGVAIATFIAEWSGLAFAIWLCRDWLSLPTWRDPVKVFNRARLIHMASVNRDIMLRSVLLQIIFVSFLFFGADFGDTPLAANQILLQFLFITAFGMDGFALAAESLVGQALGARNRAAVRRAAILCGEWGLGIGAFMAAIFWLAGPVIIDLMTTAPDVRATAKLYLPYMIAAPLIGAGAWMLDGIFIGATRARDMRNMMALSALIYGASLWLLVPWLGNHGLWLSLLISFAARGITLAIRYPALEAEADQPREYIPS